MSTFNQPSSHTFSDAFAVREIPEGDNDAEPLVHLMRPKAICDTEPRGYVRPSNRSPLEIVLDASEGFVPLWAPGVIVRWRFQERSMNAFADPVAAKNVIRHFLGEALLAWGDACPIRFSQKNDAWDFEIVMRSNDDCDVHGCVLASAFFPDPGRHRLVLYPKMFSQSEEEIVETFAHELGHIFGLRHFFAQLSETIWASEIFGEHSPFSIMNYGEQSALTDQDKEDLKLLYALVWKGQLDNINGTPIRLMKPYSSFSAIPQGLV